eukprot:TRINITY_DN576_c0_g1_i1.p1 TRINITY_DN576_c0_g1~~TRINITY_DN576_c0_g1_i1.p1  ORF type:complete len:324 (+),score=67.32 TRINITY_DN576_c0_g1_i1:503-1474(+)
MAAVLRSSRKDWIALLVGKQICFHTLENSPKLIIISFLTITSHQFLKLTLSSRNNALAISSDGEFCCFDTGLLTPRLRQIYAMFQKNKNKGMQSWFFKGWYDYVEVMELGKFADVPQRPPFVNSPTDLFFDPRVELRLDPSTIQLDADDKARLQKACPSVTPAVLDELLESRFDRTKRLVSLFPRTAVPMYFPGTKSLYLLLPLHISNMEYPDIAIAIEKTAIKADADPSDPTQWYYRYVSLFSLPTAYKFARLLGRIESDWLTIPNQLIYSARATALQSQLSAVNEYRAAKAKTKEQQQQQAEQQQEEGVADGEWQTQKKKR